MGRKNKKEKMLFKQTQEGKVVTCGVKARWILLCFLRTKQYCRVSAKRIFDIDQDFRIFEYEEGLKWEQ